MKKIPRRIFKCENCGKDFIRYIPPNRMIKTNRFYCSSLCKHEDFKSQYVLTDTRLKILKNGLQHGTMSEHRRKRLEECGRYVPQSQKTDWELYKLDVRRVTKLQPIKMLPNYNLRGHVMIRGAYHLDHIFSIKEGFLKGIPPEIIGNIINLRFISWRENLSKYDKCEISSEKLLELYNYGRKKEKKEGVLD